MMTGYPLSSKSKTGYKKIKKKDLLINLKVINFEKMFTFLSSCEMIFRSWGLYLRCISNTNQYVTTIEM